MVHREAYRRIPGYLPPMYTLGYPVYTHPMYTPPGIPLLPTLCTPLGIPCSHHCAHSWVYPVLTIVHIPGIPLGVYLSPCYTSLGVYLSPCYTSGFGRLIPGYARVWEINPGLCAGLGDYTLVYSLVYTRDGTPFTRFIPGMGPLSPF